MAASVVYTNFAGQIAVENRGGTVKEYIPDTLGSTVALAGTMSITDTWDYWPYGAVMTRTGSSPTPFTFVGTLGYFKDFLDKLLYVRARHYQPNYGRWLTVDPLWPREPANEYVGSDPTSTADPMGLQVGKDYDCLTFRRCRWLLEHGQTCTNKDKDCVFEGTTTRICCYDADKDGTAHLVVAYFEIWQCTDPCGYPTFKYLNPTGQFLVYGGRTRRQIKCPMPPQG